MKLLPRDVAFAIVRRLVLAGFASFRTTTRIAIGVIARGFEPHTSRVFRGCISDYQRLLVRIRLDGDSAAIAPPPIKIKVEGHWIKEDEACRVPPEPQVAVPIALVAPMSAAAQEASRRAS